MSIAFGGDTNLPRSALSPLKFSILELLKKRGQMSDLELWSGLRDHETQGFATTVVIACLGLQADGYIEPPSFDPHLWQLTEKGSAYLRGEAVTQ